MHCIIAVKHELKRLIPGRFEFLQSTRERDLIIRCVSLASSEGISEPPRFYDVASDICSAGFLGQCD